MHHPLIMYLLRDKIYLIGDHSSIFNNGSPPLIMDHSSFVKNGYPPWKVCNEGMVEDECHLLFTCPAYSAICSSYDDILRGSDHLSAKLRHHLEGRAHMCMPYSCIETLCFNL